MPESERSATDAVFYLGSDPDLYEGLRARLAPLGVDLRGFRTMAGMMLGTAIHRVRVLLVEQRVLPPERAPAMLLERIGANADPRPHLICLGGPGESVERLRALNPAASAAFVPPYDIARLASQVLALYRGPFVGQHSVLVVDADPREGAEIARVLRRAGVAAEPIDNALQAREALERVKPDLILLDLSLPGGGVRALTEAIRDHGKLHETPIVYLSAQPDPRRGGEVLHLGGEDFVARPIDHGHLLATVERRLREARASASGNLCPVAPGEDEDGGALVFTRTHLLQQLDQTIVEHPVPAPGQAVLFIRIDPLLPSLAPFGEEGVAAVRPVVLELIRQRSGAAHRGACMSEEGFLLWARCRDDRGIRTLAEEIRAAVEALEIPMGLSRARLTVSIGVAGFLPPAGDALTLVSRAQSVSEQARDQGGNRVLVYESPVAGALANPGQATLHALLRQALEGDGFQLVYQPILSLRKKHQERYEVLLRLRTPQGDIIPPLDFLPVASRFGLLPSIDRWVLSRALQVLRKERDAQRSTRLVIFQSSASLATPGWLHWVRDEIVRLDLIRQRPILEFNALDIAASEQHARLVFPQLGRLGIEICLAGVDDSPSILGLIARQPIGSAKISPELLAGDAGSRLDKLVQILRQAGARAIASGIEDPESIARAWSVGVDYIQGNFIQFPDDSLSFDFEETSMA